MESSDLGFEFHDNFSPVGISAGNALVECLLYTLNKLIADADAFAEANKSDLETQYYDDEGSAARVDDKAHQKRKKVEPKLTTRILGDLLQS